MEASSSKKGDQMADSGLTELEQRVLALAQGSTKGINDKDISRELPNLKPEQKAGIINKLLTKSFLIMCQEKDKTLSYKAKDPSKSTIIKGADKEEKIVYSLIEEAGNKGIWIRDIRNKSNLMQKQLNKIIKNMETKKLIKAVPSVAAGKKKVYMLFNVEPDESVSGGAWYQDQDFDNEFVDVLNQQCYSFLIEKRNESHAKMGPMSFRNDNYASSHEVCQRITDLKLSKVKLSVGDLEMILNTLIYDGKVEKKTTTDGTNLYRAVNPLISSPGLICTPCGVCTVRNNCDDLGDVTPIKCQYITEWLE